ncbi:enoyl-CoA hydratase-related protein [Thiomonas sp.]|jgi:enoyl-CoA hydratase/carnithine racemase|uniref:enoyl-CoA hydratase-related protein n=1 Tax=Thiomonas sp. TaxID=2047785 RepID=UPI00262FD09D|nr:enoyl-CoA hydratase-related protein [Thiomonas sp.]
MTNSQPDSPAERHHGAPAATDAAHDTRGEARDEAHDEAPLEGRVCVLELKVQADAAAMPASTVAAGIEALSTALRDPDIGVVVLALHGLRDAAPRAPATAAQVDAMHDWLLALRDSDKPTVAALDGDADGAALALALACDLLVASRETRLRLQPELLHSGRAAAAGWLAAQRLPGAAATALCLGCELDAVRAHAMGLIAELAPAHLAREQALLLARRLLQQPPQVLAGVKRRLGEAAAQGLPQVLAEERARWLRGEP